jgi:hypothetical protein
MERWQYEDFAHHFKLDITPHQSLRSWLIFHYNFFIISLGISNLKYMFLMYSSIICDKSSQL